MFVWCVLCSKDKRQKPGKSEQRLTATVQRESKKVPLETWMFVFCVACKDKKGKMQHNHDKETNTDKVQSTREYKK